MVRNRRAIITIGLAAVNVIVFIWLSFFGMTEDGMYMLEHGAMYLPLVVTNKEYYRLFTCMFLHFGFNHLMNNMLMLVLLGNVLEQEIGRWKYLLLYMASGLLGNVLSAIVDLKSESYAVSAGASGAIFGIIGGLFYIVIRNHGRLGALSGRGILFMIACSLYHGFTSAGIDNMAHIGGLVTGFLTALLLYRKSNRKGAASSGC